MKYLFFYIFFLLLFPSKSYSQNITPDEIIRDSRIDLLYDEIYYFPALKSQKEEAVYLPLRKWDIIFAGADLNSTQEVHLNSDIYNIAAGIPGSYDHIMIYMGKDDSGNAYIAELTISPSYNQNITYLALLNFGMDFGYFMPDASYSRIKRGDNGVVWAKTFKENLRIQLKINEDKLTARIKNDLINKFPYQLEFRHSGNILDTKVYLVDDGLEGGGSCSDYWMVVFEEYAGVCFYNIRISPDDLYNYFLNDKYGREVFVPTAINPLGFDIYIKDLLGMGYKIIPDKPHTYICDSSNSTGLIIPSLIYENENLLDIPETSKKKGLIEVLAEHNLSLNILRKLIKGALNNNY
jgi:hypothetical protein